LKSGASVVTVDVKGDVHSKLAPVVREMGGRIWYWNAADPLSISWNWLASIRDERDVEAIVRSILGKRNPHDSQPFFYERDYRWLRALIHIAHAAYGTAAKPADLLALLANRQRINDLFHHHEVVRPFDPDISDMMRLTPDEYSKAISGLLNALHLFNSAE
jgi:type IV secretory pathway TraG/TraD family ATPase VirD4